jgi:hypothetical protein
MERIVRDFMQINTELVMGDSGGSNTLKFVETEKNLGVTLSRSLKFSMHIRIQAISLPPSLDS